MNSNLVLKSYPGMGRGVCSTIPIAKGTIVEVSPVLRISAKDWKLIKQTILDSYVYCWGKSGRGVAIALGLGGLFNHSDEANLSFALDLNNQSIIYRAKRDIAALEQLTIDYEWPAKDRKKYFGSA